MPAAFWQDMRAEQGGGQRPSANRLQLIYTGNSAWYIPRWSGRLTPVGVSKQEETELLLGVYVAGMEALQQSLAKQAPRRPFPPQPAFLRLPCGGIAQIPCYR